MKKAAKKEVVKQAPTPIRFPPELMAKIKEQAGKENRPFSNMVITIIKQYYEKL